VLCRWSFLLLKKNGKRLAQKTNTGAQKKMAARQLTERTEQYIADEQRPIDINQCVPGAHARAIKPGGVDTLKTSVKDDGYKRVTNSIPLRTDDTLFTHTNSPTATSNRSQ
jgi:hypothetical protein